jgi:hemerythrin superfamily protein
MRKLGYDGDVVAYLKNQHEQIKGLFAKVLATSGDARERAFRDLRRMMAVHETAEEEIIHPAARALPDGGPTVAARLREEYEAKTALVELETMKVDSEEFDLKLRALETAVKDHAKKEEELEFDRLETTLDEDRLLRMRRAMEVAESLAPTRPHPGLESQAANMLMGPFASMMDRARDAMTAKRKN